MQFLAILVDQDSTEGYKLNKILINFSNSCKKLWIEASKEDIRLLVIGKTGLENWEDSMSKKTYWRFWTIRNHSQETARIVMTTKCFQKQKPSQCNFGGRNESCGYGHRWLWMPIVIKSNSKFVIAKLSRFWCEEEIKDFQIKFPPQHWSFRLGPRWKRPSL